jgi:hypothetical protein
VSGINMDEERGKTRSGGIYRHSNRPYYASLAALRMAHGQIFSGRTGLTLVGEGSLRGGRGAGGLYTKFLLERRVAGRDIGLAEATLRMPFALTNEQVGEELQRAFGRLFDLYGNTNFGVKESL